MLGRNTVSIMKIRFQVEIDSLSEEYVSEAKKLPPAERVQRIKKIQESYAKCREFADDKVQLAMQTYEMV